MICDLKNPGMKERHWNELEKETKIPMYNLNISFQELLSKDIMEHKEIVQELADRANREL